MSIYHKDKQSTTFIFELFFKKCPFQCVKEFEEINDNILSVELRHHAVVQTEDRLNFGLLEVVYEWARNKV